jgi:hypothetical protein
MPDVEGEALPPCAPAAEGGQEVQVGDSPIAQKACQLFVQILQRILFEVVVELLE